MRPKKISTSGRATCVASTRSRGSWKVATLREWEWRSAADGALGAKGSWTWTMSRSRPLSRRLTGSPVEIRSTSCPRRSSSSETASAKRAARFAPPRRTGKTWAMESGGTPLSLRLGGCRRFGRSARQCRAASVREDELLRLLARLVVGTLRVRALHQVAGGAIELAGDAVVECQLDQPHRVDDDAGRVRRVPD